MSENSFQFAHRSEHTRVVYMNNTNKTQYFDRFIDKCHCSERARETHVH